MSEFKNDRLTPFYLNESRLIKVDAQTNLLKGNEKGAGASSVVIQVSLDCDVKPDEIENLSNLYENLYRDQVCDVISAVIKLEARGEILPQTQIIFEGSAGMKLVCTRSQWDLRKRWEWRDQNTIIPSNEYKFRFLFSID